MSFFDEDDEPVRTTTRPRPRPRRGRPAGGAGADSQTLLIRRMVAGIAGAVILVLLVAFIDSCRDAQHKNSLEDYNRQVAGIATESAQTGSEFFKLFDRGGDQSAQELQGAINSFKASADKQLEQAQRLKVPSDMDAAQQSLLIALELRSDALQAIAGDIRTALGDEGEAADGAIRAMAGQMRAFDASDVLYEARVRPLIKRALDDAKVGGQRVVPSPFLTDITWVSPVVVAQKLDQQLTSGGGAKRNQPTGPGLHGTGLQSTAYGDTTLQPGQNVNRLTYKPGQAFVVSFTNQGDNDEFDVKVTLRIEASSGQPITITHTVPKIVKGETAKVNLGLNRTPPLGAAVTIRVTVGAVPGETKTDNNKSQYPALFQRG